MKRALLAAVVVCMVAARIGAVDAVRFSFDVFQQDTTGTDVRLYTDTAVVAKGIPATGFLAVMSVEIRLAEVDTSGVGYSVQVVTASRPAGTAARQITSEYGLPLRMTGLSGKNGARYSLAVKPLKRQTIADGSCSVTSAGLEQYKFDPTAHTDIYFLPNTFGDYYWNLYKSLFETEYDQYDQLIKFNVPGKYMVYLCPCPVASVIWDDRFGQVIDPTRGTAYVVLASGSNTADPFAVLALAVHRQFGYAPAFLVDGFVNIGSVAIDRVKGMQAAGTSISVAPLLNSWDYFTAKNPQAADAVSTAFVKFLVDQYSLDTFLQLYARADDLNLEHAIAQTYGKPVSVLQTEFEKWVAAEAITLSQYEYSAGRAEALFDYASQKKYALKMKPLMVSKYDSVRTFSMLARASFNSGDFYGATDAQRAYLVIDSTTPGWVALGGYQMMNGLYDSAQADLLSALKRDSTEMLVLMNLGLCDLFRGDTSEAGEKLFEVARAGRSGAAEARVLLGHLWLASREQAERARAVPIFQEAINAFQTRTRQHDVSPNEQMWLGMAFLGIEDQSNALSALQLADYLETRPFYRGMISLWLGKAADLRGERDVAVKYYNSVLSGASAHYTQVEARRYLNSPYSQ